MGYHIVNIKNNEIEHKYVESKIEIAYVDNITEETIIYQGEKQWNPIREGSESNYRNYSKDWYRAGIFLLGIIFIGAYIILYGLISKPNIIELLLVIGIISVYLLLFLRLGLPERSHLIEYSALCLTIHEALLERKKQGKQITHIGFWAFAITILIGLIDEIIQIFIPNRVFDVNDILFNCFTAFMAIGVSMSIQYFRQK